MLLSFSWILYSASISENIGKQLSVIDTSLIFDSSFWDIMKSFASDNYTLLGVLFAALGLLCFLFVWLKNREKLGYKFIFIYLIASFFWLIITAAKLKGHNYHQYPLLPLMVFFIAYFFVFVATNVAQLFSSTIMNHAAKVIIVAIFLFFLYSPSMEAKDRMFNTQFMGLDIAGEYLYTHHTADERVMHSSHQAYGLLWHADMMGTAGIPSNVTQIKYAEDNLNASWLFIYQWDFNIFNQERWQYLSSHYSLRQVGFVKTDTLQPVYFLLQKGGNFTMSDLNTMLKEYPIQYKDYEYSFGLQRLFYLTVTSN